MSTQRTRYPSPMALDKTRVTLLFLFLPVENLAETCYSEIHGFAVIKGIIRVPNYHKKINGFLKKKKKL